MGIDRTNGGTDNPAEANEEPPPPTAVPRQIAQAPKASPPAPTAAPAQQQLTRPVPRQRPRILRASRRFPGLPLKKRSENKNPLTPRAHRNRRGYGDGRIFFGSDQTPSERHDASPTPEDDPGHHGPGLSSAESGDHNPTSEQDQAPEGQASHPTTGWRPRQKHRRHRQTPSTNPGPPIHPRPPLLSTVSAVTSPRTYGPSTASLRAPPR